MIEKRVTKRALRDVSPSDDLAYWLSRPPEERVAAVDFLRRQFFGEVRLQRVVRVVDRTER